MFGPLGTVSPNRASARSLPPPVLAHGSCRHADPAVCIDDGLFESLYYMLPTRSAIPAVGSRRREYRNVSTTASLAGLDAPLRA